MPNSQVFWRNGGDVHVAQVKSIDARSSPLLYMLQLLYPSGEACSACKGGAGE